MAATVPRILVVDDEPTLTCGPKIILRNAGYDVDETAHTILDEFELVGVLAQRHGRLVAGGQLLRTVWGPEYLQETHHLRCCVAQVRTKLERDPSRPRYLVTESGVGYRPCDPREALP